MAKSFVEVINKIDEKMKMKMLRGRALHFFYFLISERIIVFNINSDKNLNLASTQLGLILSDHAVKNHKKLFSY